jgi:hypothetical protein
MTGGERRRLIEKEQFGIAPSPHLALASPEFETTANPAARNPSPRTESTIIAMQAAAAIAEEKPAGGIGEELTKWIDAIGKRHYPLW